jgi:hypothetical protein
MKRAFLILTLLFLIVNTFGQSRFPHGVKVGNDTLATRAYSRGYGGTGTVNSSDTSSMLAPYAKTTSVNQKLSKTDTASMLTKYARKAELNDTITVTGIVLITVGDTTVTESLGRIVYKTSNNHFYGCVYVGSAHPSWKQLDN